jgi:predicted NUDIX family NTP pyrophosphohydrolase
VPTTSAGLLLYRVRDGVLQVLIGHMGGPFWARKDSAAWSIPKGESTDSDLLATARREFEEELGCPAPGSGLEELGAFRQASGKVVWIWVVEGDLDASRCRSNTFELEWPRGSGQFIDVPEIDRAEWVDVARARSRLVRGQVPALDELVGRVRVNRPEVSEGVGVETASEP